MKYPYYISILLAGAIWMTACTGPVIIEDEGKPQTDTKQEGQPPIRDSVSIIHNGTYNSPYSIAEAQTLKRGKGVWVEGYIVGCVKSTSIKSGCNFTADATTASNILLADTFPTGNEYDYLYCMAIQLLHGSVERSDLNLYDNPNNYHRKVRIEGDLTQYISTPGMKEITGYAFTDEISYEPDDEGNDNENEEDNEDQEEPNLPHDPDATRLDTLSIAEGIKLQNKGEQPYIRGYIVGYYNGSSPIFNPSPEQMQSSRASNNVILADHIEETDWHNVIIVDLPTKTALRSNVNLKDNPQNLHRRLTVKGTLREYKDNTGYYGCMETLSKLDDDEDYYFSIE